MFSCQINLSSLTLLAIGIFGTISSANAATMIADSITDFSTTQGQNGWYYGYDNGNGFHPYLPSPNQPPNSQLQPTGTPNLLTPWGSFTATGGYFNEQTSGNWAVRRWTSDFNGTINISAKLGNQAESGFKAKILVDGVNLLSESSSNGDENSHYNYNANVKVGSVVDFALLPNDHNGNSCFDFSAEITVPSGLVFTQSNSLLSDRVGLFVDDQVYEANPGYPGGNYWNVFSGKYRAIILDNGVQNQHSLGSFIHHSTTANWSPVIKYHHVEVSDQYALSMKQKIRTRLDSGYLDNVSIISYNNFVTPEMQKGSNGTFTDVGLIEWAAEEADLNNGQGFVPDFSEFIMVNKIVEFRLEDCPSGCIKSYVESPITPMINSILTPEFLYFWIINGFGNYSSNWLQGSFESMDFILTDPLGRRLGYTAAQGLFNEIPGVLYPQNGVSLLSHDLNNYTGNSAQITEGFYTGDRLIEQFFLPHRLPGEYKIELLALNQNARATIGNNDDAKLIYVKPGEPITITLPSPTQDIPEPSSVLSLLTFGTLGAGLIWQRHRFK